MDHPGLKPMSKGAASTGDQRRRVIVVTGYSGAGMSSTLKALEDLGHETVDNLPIGLVDAMLEVAGDDLRPVAITIDGRTRDFSAERLAALVDRLRARTNLSVTLVFVDCDQELLLQRYTETRRRHPLAIDRPVSDGIRLERLLVGPCRDYCDVVLDTSLLTIHDLRRRISETFSVGAAPALLITVTSFAFRNGLPREADLVFDVRFLDNPHWDPELRPLTGLDQPVQARVKADESFLPFMDRLKALLGPLLPQYRREGKSYLTIAVGCTGGKHRSVVTARQLETWLRDNGYKVAVIHRDVRQERASPGPAVT